LAKYDQSYRRTNGISFAIGVERRVGKLGLAHGYARDDLKRLCKASNELEFDIVDFKREYPKLLKNDQIMGADQMLLLMNRYSLETLTDVPAEIMSISQANKGGQMVLDNQLKLDMLDDMDVEIGKRRRLATDAERWDEAKADEVDNNAIWKTPQVIEQEQWLDKLSKHTVYCGNNKKEMIKLARLALKYLPELNGESRKANLEAVIKQHLKHLLVLANEREDPGNLEQHLIGGLVEWVDKSNYAVLEHFIDWKNARYQLKGDGTTKERKEATDTLIVSTVMTTIARRYTEKVSECSVSKLFDALNRLPPTSHEDDSIDNNNNH
jgi:hypothetical protein